MRLTMSVSPMDRVSSSHSRTEADEFRLPATLVCAQRARSSGRGVAVPRQGCHRDALGGVGGVRGIPTRGAPARATVLAVGIANPRLPNVLRLSRAQARPASA